MHPPSLVEMDQSLMSALSCLSNVFISTYSVTAYLLWACHLPDHLYYHCISNSVSPSLFSFSFLGLPWKLGNSSHSCLLSTGTFWTKKDKSIIYKHSHIFSFVLQNGWYSSQNSQGWKTSYISGYYRHPTVLQVQSYWITDRWIIDKYFHFPFQPILNEVQDFIFWHKNNQYFSTFPPRLTHSYFVLNEAHCFYCQALEIEFLSSMFCLFQID